MFADQDASDLRAYCDGLTRTYIFNDDEHGRSQYSITLSDLTDTVREKVEHLSRFLAAAFLHGEVAHWTCLESAKNSARQLAHSDYPRSLVRAASKDGNLTNVPFACQCCCSYVNDVI